MKTLEIVVKNIELAREIATLSKVRIVREKLISKCTLMVIEGELNELMNFNDSFDSILIVITTKVREDKADDAIIGNTCKDGE